MYSSPLGILARLYRVSCIFFGLKSSIINVFDVHWLWPEIHQGILNGTGSFRLCSDDRHEYIYLEAGIAASVDRRSSEGDAFKDRTEIYRNSMKAAKPLPYEKNTTVTATMVLVVLPEPPYVTVAVNSG